MLKKFKTFPKYCIPNSLFVGLLQYVMSDLNKLIKSF